MNEAKPAVKTWAERSEEIRKERGRKVSPAAPTAPKTPLPKAAPAVVAIEVKPFGVPHPGSAPSAGTAEDPTGAKFIAWVKADMLYKQAQH